MSACLRRQHTFTGISRRGCSTPRHRVHFQVGASVPTREVRQGLQLYLAAQYP